MDYRIYKDGAIINRITADDDDVVKDICQKNGWTYIKEIEESDNYIQPTPLNMSIYDVGITTIEAGIRLANGDMDKCRKVANDYAALIGYVGGEPFEHGMVLNPGSVVVGPETGIFYLYCGTTEIFADSEIDNPAYDYNHWAIIPFFKDGYKIFPPHRPIKIYVGAGSVWWDTQAYQKYIWMGPDSPSCDLAPIYGVPDVDPEYWIPYSEDFLPSMARTGEKSKLPKKWPRIKPKVF